MTKLPCLIFTGFLGSGKTTLLNRLLSKTQLKNSAVLVNEFGEIGLDHELISHSSERLVVLSGGCVCCAMREDVEGALRELFQRRDSGEIPAFTFLVIETTGLADPIPLLMTMRSFGLARERLMAPSVVSTADAALFGATASRHPQAVRQITNADLVVLTKADLVSDEQLETSRHAVRALNPFCEVVVAGQEGALEAVLALANGTQPKKIDERPGEGANRRNDMSFWTSSRFQRPATAAHGATSFSMVFDEAIDWFAFGVWLSLLLHRHGERVLRVKGILHVSGLRGPVVIHAAQHMVHPPEHHEDWPSENRQSRLVFIVQGIEQQAIIRSMTAFLRNTKRRDAVPVLAHSAPAGAGGTIRGRPVRRPTAPRWIRG